MKIVKVIYIFCIIFALFFGWKVYKNLFPNYKNICLENVVEIKQNHAKLSEIVKLATLAIEKNNVAKNRIDLNNANPLLKQKMQELGFRSFRFELVENCNSKYRFFFEVFENWNIDILNHVEIIYSPCDVETKNGFHSYDGNHIDVYGADENWKILSDTDFI